MPGIEQSVTRHPPFFHVFYLPRKSVDNFSHRGYNTKNSNLQVEFGGVFMNNVMMKIGEMAEFNRVSIPTLRLYDKLGILKPCYTDPNTNYRYYSIYQKARLDMIQYMKELGMSLSEIKRILETGDINLIEDTLISKKQQVKAQISHLEMRLSALSRTIESVERFRKAPVCGMITVEYISHRQIYSMYTDVNF